MSLLCSLSICEVPCLIMCWRNWYATMYRFEVQEKKSPKGQFGDNGIRGISTHGSPPFPLSPYQSWTFISPKYHITLFSLGLVWNYIFPRDFNFLRENELISLIKMKIPLKNGTSKLALNKFLSHKVSHELFNEVVLTYSYIIYLFSIRFSSDIKDIYCLLNYKWVVFWIFFSYKFILRQLALHYTTHLLYRVSQTLVKPLPDFIGKEHTTTILSAKGSLSNIFLGTRQIKKLSKITKNNIFLN